MKEIDMRKKVVCQQCGSVNYLCQAIKDVDTIPTKPPEDLDWFLPMKKELSDNGEPIYVDQQGKRMKREEYILVHNLDPEIAQEKMKYHIGTYVGD
jgi:hypothetical protein